MKHSTAPKKKQPPTPEARCVRYWPTTMVDRLDEPIGFAPVCPTASTYPAAGRKKVGT